MFKGICDARWEGPSQSVEIFWQHGAPIYRENTFTASIRNSVLLYPQPDACQNQCQFVSNYYPPDTV